MEQRVGLQSTPIRDMRADYDPATGLRKSAGPMVSAPSDPSVPLTHLQYAAVKRAERVESQREFVDTVGNMLSFFGPTYDNGTTNGQPVNFFNKERLSASEQQTAMMDWLDFASLGVGTGVAKLESGFGRVVANTNARVSGAQWNEALSIKYGEGSVFWDWPKNNGVVYGADEIGTLPSGQLIGRLGKESGTFASPFGTAPEALSLRPGTDISNLNVYRVVQNIPGTRIGPAAPAFDMPGYGTQYQLPTSVDELLKAGFLERVKR